MNKYRILVLVFLIYCFQLPQAATVQGLYEGTVALTDKSTGAQTRAIRSALLQVLIKLTGKRTASGIYGVSSILNEPTRYLQQYEVKTVNNDNGEENYYLWAKFDPAVLQSSMREYSIPIWSQERPATLLWLVINSNQRLEFVESNSSGSRFYDALTYQSKSRGIDFMVPQLDSTDRSSVSEQDVSSQNFTKIKSASNRYLADAIVSATITQLSTDLWQVNWLSEINGQLMRWETSGRTISEVLSEGIDVHADKLASVYSQPIGFAGESNFPIKITGIRNFEDYAKTLNYLQSLNFVREIDIQQASGENISYSLTADGNISTFEQAISLGHTLRPVGDGETFQYIP